MVIIRMSGGLGNQMFQYALYMKLRSQGKEVLFDDINEYRHDNARPIMLSIFGIAYPRATWDQIIQMTDGSLKISHRIRRKLRGRRSLEYHEQGFYYDENVIKKDPAYLSGTFQSEKYFKDVKEDVKMTYTFPSFEAMHLPEELLRKMTDYRYQIQESEAISIHIRRGDYLFAEEVYGDICTDAYYVGAIRDMLEHYPDATFFVFSNDTKWVTRWLDVHAVLFTDSSLPFDIPEEGEEEIPAISDYNKAVLLRRFVVVEETTEYTGYLDMALMSMCNHNIIANSSFSWWAAWMNQNPDKRVIAPSCWLNGCDSSDVYTRYMTRIDKNGKEVNTLL